MSFWKGLFSSAPKNSAVAVVDVGSGSIGVAFVRLSEGQVPIVQASARIAIPFQEKLNVQRFVALMQSSLSGALDEAQRAVPGFRPEVILFGLASPWNTSQTRLVHLGEEVDFSVTANALKQILERESQLFLSTPLEAEGPKELLKNVLIESRAMQIKLNGYEVMLPIGRRAHDLDVALYLSMMPERIHDAFEETVHKRWPNVETHFHSFMFAAFDAIRGMFSDSASFVVVDIAGEVTDVALVRDNVLLESLSFPVGHNAFLRTTMRDLGLASAPAASEISAYLQGNASPSRSQQLESIFDKELREWKMLFVGALQQLSEQHPIPRDIYQFVDEEYAVHYSGAIGESSERVLGGDQEEFLTHTLSEEFLARFMKSDAGVHADIFLCVIIMILEKLLEADRKR